MRGKRVGKVGVDGSGSVKEISVADSEIDDLAWLCTYSRLATINMSHSHVSSVPPCIGELPAVSLVDLRGTALRALRPGLRSLSFAGNVTSLFKRDTSRTATFVEQHYSCDGVVLAGNGATVLLDNEAHDFSLCACDQPTWFGHPPLGCQRCPFKATCTDNSIRCQSGYFRRGGSINGSCELCPEHATCPDDDVRC